MRSPRWKKAPPPDRTDDPVRMYLREMGSVELLSREGEIAIAKRIEAGREAMIAGLCESPLTFQAIIIWRDELNEGKIFLRDIIDLEATHAGPGAKGMAAPVVIGPDGRPIMAAAGLPLAGGLIGAGCLPQTVARPPRLPAPRRSKRTSRRRRGRGKAAAKSEADFDEDDMEGSLSLAAIEAELKPKVLETFDKVADAYKRLRLQEQDIQFRLKTARSRPRRSASTRS